MGINLGGTDIGMAEKLLYRPQARPSLEQMGCETVS